MTIGFETSDLADETLEDTKAALEELEEQVGTHPTKFEKTASGRDLDKVHAQAHHEFIDNLNKKLLQPPPGFLGYTVGHFRTTLSSHGDVWTIGYEAVLTPSTNPSITHKWVDMRGTVYVASTTDTSIKKVLGANADQIPPWQTDLKTKIKKKGGTVIFESARTRRGLSFHEAVLAKSTVNPN